MVELMVASSLFLMVAASFTAAYIGSLRNHRLAIAYTAATNIAKNQIERARSMEYDSLPLLSENAVVIDENGNITAGGAYERTTIADTTTVPNCIQVCVQVRYPTFKVRLSEAPVEITTLFTNGL
jgi:hypothetical protein